MVPNRSGWFHGHDGTELYFEEYGSGRPIVLCNGVICSLGPYWRFLIPHLARFGRVVAWDYRGHGRSKLPRDIEACRIEDQAQDLRELLDHLQIASATLIGHSMGCQVILEAYRQFPDRIRALVPVCGTHGRPFSTFYGTDVLERYYDPMLREVRRHHEPIRRIAELVRRTPIPQLLARTGAVHWYLAPWSIMDEYFEHMFSMDTEFLLTVVRRMGEHSAEDLLPNVKVPTLVIAGEKDPFTPPSVAWEMQREIPRAEILVIPNGTHVAQIEHPDLVGLRIEKFLGDHDLLSAPRPDARDTERATRRRANGQQRPKPTFEAPAAKRTPRVENPRGNARHGGGRTRRNGRSGSVRARS